MIAVKKCANIDTEGETAWVKLNPSEDCPKLIHEGGGEGKDEEYPDFLNKYSIMIPKMKPLTLYLFLEENDDSCGFWIEFPEESYQCHFRKISVQFGDGQVLAMNDKEDRWRNMWIEVLKDQKEPLSRKTKLTLHFHLEKNFFQKLGFDAEDSEDISLNDAQIALERMEFKLPHPTLGQLLESETSCRDFHLVVQGVSFPVHKCILVAHSPVFRGMFESGMKEEVNGKLEIPDFTSDVVKAAIKFMYLGRIDQNIVDDRIKEGWKMDFLDSEVILGDFIAGLLGGLLIFANKYSMDNLKVHCLKVAQYLSTILSPKQKQKILQELSLVDDIFGSLLAILGPYNIKDINKS